MCWARRIPASTTGAESGLHPSTSLRDTTNERPPRCFCKSKATPRRNSKPKRRTHNNPTLAGSKARVGRGSIPKGCWEAAACLRCLQGAARSPPLRPRRGAWPETCGESGRRKSRSLRPEVTRRRRRRRRASRESCEVRESHSSATTTHLDVCRVFAAVAWLRGREVRGWRRLRETRERTQGVQTARSRGGKGVAVFRLHRKRRHLQTPAATSRAQNQRGARCCAQPPQLSTPRGG